jgi:hypothetical protein
MITHLIKLRFCLGIPKQYWPQKAILNMYCSRWLTWRLHCTVVILGRLVPAWFVQRTAKPVLDHSTFCPAVFVPFIYSFVTLFILCPVEQWTVVLSTKIKYLY